MDPVDQYRRDLINELRDGSKHPDRFFMEELCVLIFRLTVEQRATNELLARIPVDSAMGAVVTYDCSGIDEIPG